MGIMLAVLLAGLAAGLVAWVVLTGLQPGRKQVLANLNRQIVEQVEEKKIDNGPGALTRAARTLTPDLVVRTLDRQHIRAGRPASWPMDRLLVLKLCWVPVGIVLTLLILPVVESPLVRLVWLLTTVVVYFLPELLLNSEGTKRSEQVERALADTLDQMTIAVESGLGFDSAMSRAAKNGRGPLADELTRTLQDIQIGHSRRQAFDGLATRTTVPDLRRFVRAVIQADAYGISIADVLRTQADEMRLKRRQRAEEKAQKLPVKVLGPVMICILPVLFIVVMGPAAMNIVDAFSGM